MQDDDRNGDRTDPLDRADVSTPRKDLSSRGAPGAGRTVASDADQTASDADQTLSDADQTASTADQEGAERDQDASDRDQAIADRELATAHEPTAADRLAHATSRDERESVSIERLSTRQARRSTARDRDLTAADRDRIAAARDEAARVRDDMAASVARLGADPDASLLEQLERMATEAAADRARAAGDRARAAADRANAARERERLEAELHSAHLDELTGTFRREMGHLALSHEIDRARRSDGLFVLAFVDVDGLKVVNDRDGHVDGDRMLQAVVAAIHARLRSFDPIVRFGGDEFVCGLGGTDIAEAERRFASISETLKTGSQIGISYGLAALQSGDTVDELIERADAGMLAMRAKHRVGR